MTLKLRITGPGVNREVSLPASGAELSLGRDASADLVLSDPEKWISRKHVGARALADGIGLRVLSSVNGIETSAGPLGPGQTGTVAAGGHFVVGPFRMDVVAGPAAAPAVDASDPFAALFGGAAAAPGPVGEDPFSQAGFMPPPPPPPPAAGDDPFSAFGAPAGNRPATPAVAPLADFFGGGSTGDPLAALGGGGGGMGLQGVNPSPKVSDWLGGGPPAGLSAGGHGGPLDQFLGTAPATPARSLSPEHVHSIHMPLAFGSAPPQATPPPRQTAAAPPPSAPPAMGAPSGDAWDMLMGGDAAVPAPAPAPAPPPADAATAWPPPPQGKSGHSAGDPFVDIGIDDDDAFAPWSTTVVTPLRDLDPEAVDLPPPASSSGTQSGSFGSKTLVQSRAEASGSPDGVWAAFADGLGLPADHGTNLESAERAGTMVRLLIEGLSQLLAARAELKRELRADDRTMLSGRDNNPLKLELSAHELVQYLFAAQVMGGYMPAERAVRESVSELVVHEVATIAATRAAVEGALRDFEPARLKKKLMGGKSGMFQMLDNAKIWEAYQQHYEKQSQHMADWLETMFSRHFMPAYSRETERLKSQGEKKPTA